MHVRTGAAVKYFHENLPYSCRGQCLIIENAERTQHSRVVKGFSVVRVLD